MPALGYTFCCNVNEAAEFIPEIPKHCIENEEFTGSGTDEVDADAESESDSEEGAEIQNKNNKKYDKGDKEDCSCEKKSDTKRKF